MFHNLPPGGARRAAYELVRATADRHDYDLYAIDMGAADRYAADPQRARQDLSEFAREAFVYPLPTGVRDRVRGVGDLAKAFDVVALLRLHRRIAADIDSRAYDLAVVHHDQITQAPGLLESMATTAVYYLQEPRRQTFEYDFARRRRPATGIGRLVRRMEARFEMHLGEIDIRAARAADVMAVNSYYSAESAYRAYGRYGVVSYLGVDTDVFTTSDERPARRGIISVGALHSSKGHDLVIEAAGRLPLAERPPVTVVYERETNGEPSRLAALARESGVELSLRRSIDDVALAQLYRSSLATVCAASLEPFGLTAVESMACGTPVVAVREGGFREVVTPGNGYLVDRDPGALADAVRDLVARPDTFDPAALRDAVASFWSWRAAGERLDRVLQMATKTRSDA